MMLRPDLTTMTLPELRALNVALRHAIDAVKSAKGGDAVLYMDAEGVSVTFTVPIGHSGKEAGK